MVLKKLQDWEDYSLFGGWGGGGEVSTPLHAMNVMPEILVWQRLYCCLEIFFLLGIQLPKYISRSSQDIISLQKLYCFFKILILIRILLRTLDMVVLRSPLQGYVFLNFLADLKISLELLEYFIYLFYFAYFIFQIFYRRF